MAKIKVFEFNGFGFPIVLTNVPTLIVRGKSAPNINYKSLAKIVVSELCSEANHAPLSGHQVFFLRQQLQMTTRSFGQLVNSSHVAVLKWEKRGDLPALMSKANEIVLRLRVLNELKVKPAMFIDIIQNLQIDEPENYLNSQPLRIAL